MRRWRGSKIIDHLRSTEIKWATHVMPYHSKIWNDCILQQLEFICFQKWRSSSALIDHKSQGKSTSAGNVFPPLRFATFYSIFREIASSFALWLCSQIFCLCSKAHRIALMTRSARPPKCTAGAEATIMAILWPITDANEPALFISVARKKAQQLNYFEYKTPTRMWSSLWWKIQQLRCNKNNTQTN